MRNKYVAYIVAMRLYFSQLWTAALSTGVATVGNLTQLLVWDTEKQRQHRCNNTSLTESGNTSSKQLLMMPNLNILRPSYFFRYEISELLFFVEGGMRSDLSTHSHCFP